MDKKYNTIIVTGSIAYDVIMDFPSEFVKYFQPDKLHQINISFVVDRLEKQLGGIATNIAYNLSFVTKKDILPVGYVGKDGKNLIDFLKRNHIKTNGVKIDKNLYTATGNVITDLRDNQIWAYYYGALKKCKEINLLDYIKNKNTSVVTICASHPEGFTEFQKQAIKHKIDYLYDPGMVISAVDKKIILEGIKNCRWLVGNDYEIGLFEKMINDSLINVVPKNAAVITTLGEKGVHYQDKNNTYTVSAIKVRKVVDPTGAGDAWRAGFLAGIVDGKTIRDSLKLGNVLASFAIEKYGTVNHRPTRKEIEKRLQILN